MKQRCMPARVPVLLSFSYYSSFYSLYYSSYCRFLLFLFANQFETIHPEGAAYGSQEVGTIKPGGEEGGGI